MFTPLTWAVWIVLTSFVLFIALGGSQKRGIDTYEAYPLHPPPRSAPARATKWKQDTSVAFAKWHCAEPAVTMTSTQGHKTFLFMNTNLAG